MDQKAHTIAVVGASLAGLKVVEQVRRCGFEGRLVLIGEEPHLPYDRPPLSKKILLREATLDDLALRTLPWEELDVELKLGVRATALDARTRTLTLADGEQLQADHVFLCTGVTARQLPGVPPRPGLHVLRTIEDAQAIDAALRNGTHVVVVGGGFIGAEVAAVARSLGAPVTLVEPGATLMLRGLGERWGRHMEALHRAQGVDLRCGAFVARVIGEERVEAVELSDGTRIETSLVVVGIGADAATEWLEGSGLALDAGVLVNEYGQTSYEGIWAVGDVARFRHQRYGCDLRVEHWTNAVEMARAVVTNALQPEKRAPYDTIPMVWSDQYHLKIQIAGRISPEMDEVIVQGTPEEGEFLVLYGDQGKLAGAISFNRAALLVRMKQLMAKDTDFEQAVAFAERGGRPARG